MQNILRALYLCKLLYLSYESDRIHFKSVKKLYSLTPDDQNY